MIGIQSIMLIMLGFLVAGFFALLVAPSYQRRAARLATDKLKRTMPLSEAEIRADKDRLRADYAVFIHELQLKVDSAADTAARQRIELNRRDAAISSLEGEMGEMRKSLDEHQNARRVLEQSIMDRLPKVEQRLGAAKKLLSQRDQEIARLTQTADRQKRAMEEAQLINAKQRDEVHRLDATLKTRSARNRDQGGDARFDGEVALKSEIEALRAKSRDQSSLISRLQASIVGAGGVVNVHGDAVIDKDDVSAKGEMSEIARLSADLAAAEAGLRDAQSETSVDRTDRSKLTDEIRKLKSDRQDQDAKLAEVTAALEAYKSAEKDNKVLAESKMALKAQVMALEAQSKNNAKTIESLRSELAGAHERLARQAKHFMDEMRRLGAGTVPTGKSTADNDDAATASDQRRGARRQSLSDRISEPRAPATKSKPEKDAAIAASAVAVSSASPASKPASSSVSELIRPIEASSSAASGRTAEAENASPRAAHNDDAAATNVVSKKESDTAAKPSAGRRPGLMERITQLDKSKAPSKSA